MWIKLRCESNSLLRNNWNMLFFLLLLLFLLLLIFHYCMVRVHGIRSTPDESETGEEYSLCIYKLYKRPLVHLQCYLSLWIWKTDCFAIRIIPFVTVRLTFYFVLFRRLSDSHQKLTKHFYHVVNFKHMGMTVTKQNYFHEQSRAESFWELSSEFFVFSSVT
jgi:uncharacterized protein YpmS